MIDFFIRPKEADKYDGLKRTAREDLIRKGSYPDAIKLTDAEHCAAKAWLASHVQCWQAWRVARHFGETDLLWREWFAQHRNRAAQRDGGKAR
ncbi:hypothetical protein [Methyloceanibacter sp.]|uniref:hypothetical protein n=1 Tax=Methyloceanibacter sp. TaxID=1965321 RepID=UPI002C0EF5DB|nr:hypothetical protein [Methyloceanibacter sp.]HML91087.1 hypothetical protein [Methyloceanibacter sp.]